MDSEAPAKYSTIYEDFLALVLARQSSMATKYSYQLYVSTSFFFFFIIIVPMSPNGVGPEKNPETEAQTPLILK